MSITSYNQQVICEPYRGSRGLRSKISSGVAIVEQKTSLVGLKVLRDAFIDDKIIVKAGDVVYIREEILSQFKEYSNPISCVEITGQFVLVNFGHISFVNRKE